METEEIHRSMLENVPNEYEKIPGSFVYDTTRAPAIQLKKVYEEIRKVEEKQDIENLSNEELAQQVYERTGITRHPATFATTTVIVTGQPDAVVSIGEIVSTGAIYYSFAETKTVDQSGKASVLVASESSGSIGNTPANTITEFPASLPGLTSVTNPNPVVDGYNAETDVSLKTRYYEYLQAPATSGNKAHYKMWAKEVTGVGDAQVFPTWNGGGTVKVVIIDANKRGASAELIDAVYDHIEESRPIGAVVTVVSAKEKIINVAAKVVLAINSTIGQVQSDFEKLLIKKFADIAYQESYVSYAKTGILLLETGINDYSNLSLNNSTANISLGDEEIPVLGTVTLEV